MAFHDSKRAMAPGVQRRFGFERLLPFQAHVWQQLRAEARRIDSSRSWLGSMPSDGELRVMDDGKWLKNKKVSIRHH